MDYVHDFVVTSLTLANLYAQQARKGKAIDYLVECLDRAHELSQSDQTCAVKHLIDIHLGIARASRDLDIDAARYNRRGIAALRQIIASADEPSLEFSQAYCELSFIEAQAALANGDSSAARQNLQRGLQEANGLLNAILKRVESGALWQGLTDLRDSMQQKLDDLDQQP